MQAHAVRRLQAWLQKPFLPCLLQEITALVTTESLGWHQMSDSCDELLSRDIKLAVISVRCQQLIVVHGREACLD